MCGRLNVIADPLCQLVSATLRLNFNTINNNDLRPSDTVATIIKTHQHFTQCNSQWGIKPAWSKRLLINAQSETVASKPTFAQAFAQQRCLIPCSGWYEWRAEATKKQKYHFSHVQQQPLYMAGILYPHPQTLTESLTSPTTQLVSLTTSANTLCQQYHSRMPVLILAQDIDKWFSVSTNELISLMQPISEQYLAVSVA